ncbi:MAG: hypothetical protein Q9199_006557 [Rusavskia elegans]
MPNMLCTVASERSEDGEVERWCGYYTLSQQRLPRYVSQGWRLGRGSSRTRDEDRAVGLLIIGPGKRARGVAPIHALIQFHPKSGVLMIVGVLDEKPVQYKITDSTIPLILSKGEKHVLSQPRNRIRVGNLYYNLVFEEFDDREYARYRIGRDSLFQELGYSEPHAALSAVPRHQDAKKGPVVTHGTMNQGAFGWVFTAVDAHNGQPLAVKEHRLKNKETARQVRAEIDIGTFFAQETGILPTLFTWCEHQVNTICGRIPESVFAASPLGLCDFSQYDWSTCSINQVIELRRGPLQGLAALHKTGYMYRDVHRRNLLIISLEPPRAVIHDFGKSIHRNTHRDKHLGPIPTLAPEVNGFRDYTNAIDIWGLAFACCYSVLPRDQREVVNHKKPMNKQCYTSIKIHLSSYAKVGELESLLVELLSKMLEWNPHDRISAAEALRHPCTQGKELPARQGTDSQYLAQWNTSLASSESTTLESPADEPFVAMAP